MGDLFLCDHPGPINNEPLLTENGQLKQDLNEEINYVLLPYESWSLLNDEFGLKLGQSQIARQVVEVGAIFVYFILFICFEFI